MAANEDIPMKGDTEIIVSEYTERDLPHLHWALGCDVNPDELTTTLVEIRSGAASPHTTIALCAAKDDPTTYWCLWWTSRDLFHTFRIPLGGSSGCRLLSRVLEIIERHNKTKEMAI